MAETAADEWMDDKDGNGGMADDEFDGQLDSAR